MNTGIKIIVCAATAAIAMTMAVFTLAGFSQPKSERRIESTQLGEMSYVLGESDGSIAVFAAGEKTPLLITNIRIDQLRQADRDMIRAGLPASSEEELVRLLEDLGS